MLAVFSAFRIVQDLTRKLAQPRIEIVLDQIRKGLRLVKMKMEAGDLLVFGLRPHGIRPNVKRQSTHCTVYFYDAGGKEGKKMNELKFLEKPCA
jgi:hypothetical protein